jgi:glycosyltransferase involved in cell wall biosynthesis
VLNSHEIMRRQLLHWSRLNFHGAVEIIIVDDGSDPSLVNALGGILSSTSVGSKLRNLRFMETHDTRPWTWALARNAGAKQARGDYLLMTDIDYILPQQAIDAAMNFSGDKLRFKREFAVLDEHGLFTQDHATLNAYGLPWKRIRDKGTKMPPHPNNFCIRRELFWAMGGYREDLIDRPYPQGEDRHFKWQWIRFCKSGLAKESESDDRPTIYMFPNGQFCGDVDYNPNGLFHDLSRKTEFNRAHLKLTGALVE